MGKWKVITAGLVLVILILCMMTFYLNNSNHNFLIQLNRMDREKAEMQRDYEKLYNAYYSYDKKVLKLLESNPNVFWAKDSSAYVVKKEKEFVFAFYRKPNRSLESYSLFIETNSSNRDPVYKYRNIKSVDSLKSHQFIVCKRAGDEQSFMVARGGMEPYNTLIKINLGTR